MDLESLLPAGVTRRAALSGLAASAVLLSAGAMPALAQGRAGWLPSPPAPVDHLFGREIRRIPTSEQVVALTFNAAWDGQGLDTVLTVLRQQKAPATFFLTGHFAQRHPAAARAITAAGHGVANHSHSHPPFGELTRAERAQEVELADRAIRTATGTVVLPFFRFPYGDTTPAQIAEVNALGYADIEWTTDTTGYKGTASGMTVQKAVKRALDALTPGEIVQMHIGSLDGQGPVIDAQALPQLIDAVRSRGYRIADLRTLLTPAPAPALATP
ncbi:polysaccharide deacetylase family protein [Streptomyces sp. NPDC053429]|uniref:polysaccharide deacetylase family protein n=1 Tax=Streptomyces sp. NPDC053429 TaxID=3365702 RepID=UPI0037D6A6B7